MAKGRKTGGRQKGTPNKLTASVKAAFQEAFDNLGGVPALVSWAQSEPTEFYKLYSKLLPAEVRSNVDANMSGSISIVVDTGVPRAPDE